MNDILGISQFTFDQEFIDVFIKLKIYFGFQIEYKKVEKEEFDFLFNKIKGIIQNKFKCYDPFDKGLFTKIDNYIEKAVDFHIEDELLHKSIPEAAYLIYLRKKIRELNNYINTTEFNLVSNILKKIKIKMSTILKNIYPIYIYSNYFKSSKEISLSMLFNDDDEIIINFQSSMEVGFMINKIDYIIKHLGYINRDMLSVIEFYRRESFDIKNLINFTESMLNFSLRVTDTKDIDNINLNVAKYIILWAINSLYNILVTMKNNEKNT